ncbi:MAG: HigA family addiction module antitoxin [Deltaproteobacteria bacterium]|jgi:addiction module HigA family antidote|nr:HigA family addiction module antitoxin [Deltaproteobacteria bacterium]
MGMYNPPHPGEFIREVYLKKFNISYRSVALQLKVSPSTFLRLIKGQSNVSPEMALRLSKGLGRSPESWLAMQGSYNLWHVKQTINLNEIEPLAVTIGGKKWNRIKLVLK